MGGQIKLNLMVSADRASISASRGSPINHRVDRVFQGSLSMKKPFILYAALCAGLLPPAAFAGGGGMGSHGMSTMGGAFGTSAAAPGTNSLGTALSSSGVGHGPINGPLLGTSSAVDREEVKVEKMIGSICRGC
jgi:hypothetical protein